MVKHLIPIGNEEDGAPGPIRTGDPLLRRQMLYPTELRAHWSELIQCTALGAFFATSNFGPHSKFPLQQGERKFA